MELYTSKEFKVNNHDCAIIRSTQSAYDALIFVEDCNREDLFIRLLDISKKLNIKDPIRILGNDDDGFVLGFFTDIEIGHEAETLQEVEELINKITLEFT